MRRWVEGNFNAVLALSVVFGMLMPGLELLPKASAIAFISVAIFFSCPYVSVAELKSINIKQAGAFFIARFLVLPIVIYYAALALAPDYAIGILLIALVPVGASTTTVAALIRANSAFCLSATVLTNIFAPFLMFGYLYFLVGSDAQIDVVSVLISAMLGIFVPVGVYFFGVRHFTKAKGWVKDNSKLYATLFIALMIAYVVALEKSYILSNLDSVLWMSVIGLALFAVLYLFAYGFGAKMDWRMQKTYMLCSGVNNTGLASGLAVLYFSSETVLFTIIAEVPWILTLMIFKGYVDWRDG